MTDARTPAVGGGSPVIATVCRLRSEIESADAAFLKAEGDAKSERRAILASLNAFEAFCHDQGFRARGVFFLRDALVHVQRGFSSPLCAAASKTGGHPPDPLSAGILRGTAAAIVWELRRLKMPIAQARKEVAQVFNRAGVPPFRRSGMNRGTGRIEARTVKGWCDEAGPIKSNPASSIAGRLRQRLRMQSEREEQPERYLLEVYLPGVIGRIWKKQSANAHS